MNDLNQAEADALLAMMKRPVLTSELRLPSIGGVLKVELKAEGSGEEFLLDLSRSRIELTRGKLQHRVRTTIVLARLDIGGAPHRNPDGVELPCPHLHLYQEGFGDKWAFLLPSTFSNDFNHADVLSHFLAICNIVDIQFYKQDLFA